MNLAVSYYTTETGEPRIKWGENEFVLVTPEELAELTEARASAVAMREVLEELLRYDIDPGNIDTVNLIRRILDTYRPQPARKAAESRRAIGASVCVCQTNRDINQNAF